MAIDSPEVGEVRNFLRRYGFAAYPIIETSEHKTPDILAQVGQERFLVEVKAKVGDEQLATLMSQPS